MQKFKSWLESGVQTGHFSAASLALVHHGQVQFLNVGAFPDLQGASVQVNENHWFDCASVTKSVPTGLLALQAIEEGLWNLDSPVLLWIPELKMSMAQQIQISHLLTHTLDYRISMSSLKDLKAEQIWETLFTHEFEHKPGQSYLYCNASSMLLGLALERLYQKPLAELAQEKIFNPLGMYSTGFKSRDPKIDVNQVVPTEICAWRGREIRGEVHDESSYALLPQNLGSAGLFSTCADLSKVIVDLMSEQSVLLQSTTRLKMSQNQISHLQLSVGLGFELNSPKWMAGQFNQLLGKTGFTGSCIAFDPGLSKGMVLLCNWTWPHRKKSPQAIFDFRKRGTELLWEL